MNALHSPSMLSWLLSYLFNALWQIPLVFAAARIAARMLRRAHPRIAHRVWVGALLLQVVLPACDLRLGTLLWRLFLQSASWIAWLLPWGQGSAIHDGHIRVLAGPAAITAGGLRLPHSLETGIVLLYACTVVYFAGRLAWGLVQTRRLAREATRLTLTGEAASRWIGHCRRMGITVPRPEIAASPHGIGPVTVGLRRGLVLVPCSFLENIPAADLDAVLAHELAHIQRYDFAKNLLYGLVSLPMAWHPFVWRTRVRAAETRELACDAIAAEAVDGRRQYAQSLLRLAAMLAGNPPIVTMHALGILSLNTDARIFERRIMTLTHASTQMSTARRIVVAASCCIVALATCTTALALRMDVSPIAPVAENQASGIMTGQKISGGNPTYPPEARKKKIQGAVVIDAVIGKDGAIENLRVLKSPSKALSESALKAVRTWRYQPYLLNGNPVEIDTTINVVYTLGG